MTSRIALRTSVAALLALFLLRVSAALGPDQVAVTYEAEGTQREFKWAEVADKLATIDSGNLPALRKALAAGSLEELSPGDRQLVARAAREFAKFKLLEEEAESMSVRQRKEVIQALARIERMGAIDLYLEEVALPDMAQAIDIETLRSFYRVNIGQYQRPEHRSARYVFISHETAGQRPGWPEELLRRIKEGETTLADAAHRYSEQPSARDGGYLPPFARGKYGFEEFEEAIFSMNPGDDPVMLENERGFYIVRTERVLPGSDIPFEQAIEDLRMRYAKANRLQVLSAFAASRMTLYEVAPAEKVNDLLGEGERESVLVESPRNEAVLTLADLRRFWLEDDQAQVGEEEFERIAREAILYHEALQRADLEDAGFRHQLDKEKIQWINGMIMDELMQEPPPATDEAARAYYEEHRDSFIHMPKVDAIQYLFRPEPSEGTYAGVQRAAFELQQKLESIVAEARKDGEATEEELETLMAERSLEPASRELMVKVVGDASDAGRFLNSAEAGDVSDPIFMGEQGFALYLLLERYPPENQEFEEVVEDIRSLLGVIGRRRARAAMWDKLFGKYDVRLALDGVNPEPTGNDEE